MSLERHYLEQVRLRIHTAAAEGDSVFIKYALDKFPYGSADFFTLERSSKKTPYTIAKEHNQTAVMKLFMGLFRFDLCDHAYTLQVGSNYSPLHEACRMGDLKTIRKFLRVLDSAKNLFAVNKAGDTPLHTAVKASQIAAAILIVISIPRWWRDKILKKDAAGETAVDIACRLGHVDFFKKAVFAIKESNEAAEIFKEQEKKYTKFVKKYRLTVFDKKLLPKKNLTSKLHLACERGDDETVSMYCKYEKGLLQKDEEGRSPLHLACLHGHATPLASYMVRYEKKPGKLFVKDNYGQTPFLLGWEHKRIREMFFRNIGTNGKRIELLLIPDKNGKSLLHLACEHGFEEIVEEYMDVKGFESALFLELKDRNGDTPFTLALRNEHEAVVNICLRAFKDTLEVLFPFAKEDPVNFLTFLLLNGDRQTASSFIKYLKLV